jgi:hypothetical protein
MQNRFDFEKWDITIVFRTPVTVPIVIMHHHIRIIIITIVATAAIYIFPAFFPSRRSFVHSPWILMPSPKQTVIQIGGPLSVVQIM